MRFKGLFLTIFVFFFICSLSFAQGLAQPPMVRLIYFVPSDREPQPDIDTKMDALIKDVQIFYANQMEAHGFQRKTFIFETDADGKAVVNHIAGRFTDEYYNNLAEAWEGVWKEINERFDTSKNIYFTAIDIRNVGGPCGIGSFDGSALLPASGPCFSWRVAAHELAHTFGLHHADYLTDAKPDRSYTGDPMLNAFCTAKWLDVHRAFNPPQVTFNNEPATIKRPLLSLVSPPNIIRLRFEVTDPDGIQQVQFFTQGDQIGSPLKWVGCKSLNGTSRGTVEFVTTYLTPKSKSVDLQVMDIHGGTTSLVVPIDITPLLPDKVVSIPDANLAAAVQKEIGNSITTRTMLNLTRLDAHNHQITDLTGLEHAHNLEYLNLGDRWTGGTNNNSISNFSPVADLTQLHTLMLNDAISEVSDISELATLPKLVWLELTKNAITDIAPLATFTQLEYLWLQDNAISDISALSSLTQLTDLHLSNNAISDISVLTRLKHLRLLSLDDNPIANIVPLAELTQLVILHISGTTVSDITPLAGLKQLQELYLNDNNISDVAPLAGLAQLIILFLLNNAITDIAPLIELNLTGTSWNSTGLYLKGNPLSYASINMHIPAMQAKGIEVTFDNSVKISGDTQDDSITGPWLWMIAPTAPYQGGAASTNVDTLALVSEGRVTEAEIAKKGANEGDSVGNYRWTLAEIRNTGIGNPFNFVGEIDNVTDVAHRIGWAEGDVDHHSSYALITLESATAQENVVMRVGSDDSIKVWLNGAVVHNNPVNRGSRGFQDTFRVNLRAGNNLLLIKVSENWGNWSMFVGIEAEVTAVYKSPASTPSAAPASDVNQDGQVNVLDLILVAQHLGETILGNPRADVNGDGEVNILDLAFVASAFGEDTVPAAPAISLAQTDVQEIIPAIQTWIHLAQVEDNGSVVFRQGIDNLQRLLASLLPQKTALLPNYPNPFNPETWIPYQLARDSAVLIRIYTANGTLVKTLQLGHQTAGIYQSRNRAAYWDGKNEIGESVASGIYFYALAAGDFNATGKMLIRK